VRSARRRLGGRPQRLGRFAAPRDPDPGVDGGDRAPCRRPRRSPSVTRLDKEHVGRPARRDAREIEQGGEIEVERAPDPPQDGGRQPTSAAPSSRHARRSRSRGGGDWLILNAEARLALARALHAAGDAEAAESHARAAVDMFRAKEYALGATAAEAFHRSLALAQR
jgi:hypothetical protein